MLKVELEEDNKYLINANNTEVNKYLRYGKILMTYLEKSQVDVKAVDLSDKITNNINARLNNIQQILSDKLDKNIIDKMTSAEVNINNQLDKIDKHINDSVQNKLANINLTISKTDAIITNLTAMLTNNNDTKTKESAMKFREDLVTYLNDIKLQMAGLNSKTSARDVTMDLLNSNIQSDIKELKLQIIDTIRKNMDEKGIMGKIEDIKSYIDKSRTNSATKGKVMESKINDILQSINEDYKIENTSSKAKQSDFQLTSEKYKILVEVKDYERNLPTAELDKFKYNVKTIACDGGIILNDKFGFAKFKFSCLKIIEVDNKPVILLSKFNNSKVKLQMAIRLLELAIDIKRKTIESKENNRALELEQQLTKSNTYIKNIEDKNKKARVVVDNFIKQQINTINNFRDQVMPLILL